MCDMRMQDQHTPNFCTSVIREAYAHPRCLGFFNGLFVCLGCFVCFGFLFVLFWVVVVVFCFVLINLIYFNFKVENNLIAYIKLQQAADDTY